MTHLEKAQELRARTDVHFNCCQSVLVAFAEDMGLRACLKTFDKNGGVGDNRKKQAGAGENASIPK